MIRGIRIAVIGLSVWAVAGVAMAKAPRGPILLDAPTKVVQAQISRGAALEDLRSLDQTIRAMVPDGALIPAQDETNAFLSRAASSLPATLSRRQMAAITMELAGSYSSSHIYLLFPFENWNLDADRGGRRLNRSVALAPDDALLIDNRPVQTINGRAATDFVDWVKGSYGRFNPLRLPQRVREGGAEMLWLWGIDGPFTIVFRDGSQEVIEGVAMSRREHPLASQSQPTSQTQTSQAPFSLLIEKTIARLDIETLDQRFVGEWEALMSELQAGIAQGKVTSLIVDLRGNRGGAGRLSVGLLKVLTGTDVPMSGGKRWKRSKAYEDGLAEFVPPLLRFAPWRRAILGADGVAALDSIPMGETRLFGSNGLPKVTSILPSNRVRILIDHNTGSSATQLARAIQFFKLGELIGAPTSSSTSELGEIAFFRLENSQLVFASPSAEFLDVSGQRTSGPVMPDVLVCGDNGLFEPGRALDVALNMNPPDVRQILKPVFQANASESDYCGK
ncbi:S41 family peptidase [Aquidulcibacter paucihalophilus]|uniref:S41 family peptidase n=1 Tax=Aquidulcibacter paucihalophilus TaxID=1978549 RepID=UPI000A19222C|nr:S41 family peptidase [Aquidulcibacter paucihalophilus]